MAIYTDENLPKQESWQLPQTQAYQPTLRDQIAAAYNTPTGMPTAGNEFTRGLTSTALNLRASDFRQKQLEAMRAKNFALADEYKRQADDLEQQAYVNAPINQNFTDALESPSRLPGWAMGALGSMVPTVLPTLAVGAAGAFGAGRLAKKFGLDQAKAQALGGWAGGTIPAYQMERNEAISEAMANPEIMANRSLDEIANTAMVKGGLAAGMEALVPAAAGGFMRGASKVLPRGVNRLAKGEVLPAAGTEFLTEGAQSLIGQSAQNYLEGKSLTDYDWIQALNEAAAGAVGGAGMAAPGALGRAGYNWAQGKYNSPEVQERVQAAREKLNLGEQKANEHMQKAAEAAAPVVDTLKQTAQDLTNVAEAKKAEYENAKATADAANAQVARATGEPATANVAPADTQTATQSQDRVAQEAQQKSNEIISYLQSARDNKEPAIKDEYGNISYRKRGADGVIRTYNEQGIEVVNGFTTDTDHPNWQNIAQVSSLNEETMPNNVPVSEEISPDIINAGVQKAQSAIGDIPSGTPESQVLNENKRDFIETLANNIQELVTDGAVKGATLVDKIKNVFSKKQNGNYLPTLQNIENGLKAKEQVRSSVLKNFPTINALNSNVKIYSTLEEALVDNVDMLDDIRAMTNKGISYNDITGFFIKDKNKVALIADAIEPGRELETFLHEVGVHAGLAQVLGKKNIDDIAQRIFYFSKYGTQEEQAIAKKAIEQAETILNGGRENTDFNEELIAYFVQYCVNSGAYVPYANYRNENTLWHLMDSILEIIKKFVIGKHKIKAKNITPQQLVNMAWAMANDVIENNSSQQYDHNLKLNRDADYIEELALNGKNLKTIKERNEFRKKYLKKHKYLRKNFFEQAKAPNFKGKTKVEVIKELLKNFKSINIIHKNIVLVDNLKEACEKNNNLAKRLHERALNVGNLEFTSYNSMAFYDPEDKKCYLFLEAFRSRNEFLSVFLHELGVHSGFKNALKYDLANCNGIANIIKNWAEKNDETVESQLAQRAIQSINNTPSYFLEEVDGDRYNEEVVAHFVTHAIQNGIYPTAFAEESQNGDISIQRVKELLDRIFNSLKQFLSSFGLIPETLTAQQIVDFAWALAAKQTGVGKEKKIRKKVNAVKTTSEQIETTSETVEIDDADDIPDTPDELKYTEPTLQTALESTSSGDVRELEIQSQLINKFEELASLGTLREGEIAEDVDAQRLKIADEFVDLVNKNDELRQYLIGEVLAAVDEYTDNSSFSYIGLAQVIAEYKDAQEAEFDLQGLVKAFGENETKGLMAVNPSATIGHKIISDYRAFLTKAIREKEAKKIENVKKIQKAKENVNETHSRFMTDEQIQKTQENINNAKKTISDLDEQIKNVKEKLNKNQKKLVRQYSYDDKGNIIASWDEPNELYTQLSELENTKANLQRKINFAENYLKNHSDIHEIKQSEALLEEQEYLNQIYDAFEKHSVYKEKIVETEDLTNAQADMLEYTINGILNDETLEAKDKKFDKNLIDIVYAWFNSKSTRGNKGIKLLQNFIEYAKKYEIGLNSNVINNLEQLIIGIKTEQKLADYEFGTVLAEQWLKRGRPITNDDGTVQNTIISGNFALKILRGWYKAVQNAKTDEKGTRAEKIKQWEEQIEKYFIGNPLIAPASPELIKEIVKAKSDLKYLRKELNKTISEINKLKKDNPKLKSLYNKKSDLEAKIFEIKSKKKLNLTETEIKQGEQSRKFAERIVANRLEDSVKGSKIQEEEIFVESANILQDYIERFDNVIYKNATEFFDNTQNINEKTNENSFDEMEENFHSTEGRDRDIDLEKEKKEAFQAQDKMGTPGTTSPAKIKFEVLFDVFDLANLARADQIYSKYEPAQTIQAININNDATGATINVAGTMWLNKTVEKDKNKTYNDKEEPWRTTTIPDARNKKGARTAKYKYRSFQDEVGEYVKHMRLRGEEVIEVNLLTGAFLKAVSHFGRYSNPYWIWDNKERRAHVLAQTAPYWANYYLAYPLIDGPDPVRVKELLDKLQTKEIDAKSAGRGLIYYVEDDINTLSELGLLMSRDSRFVAYVIGRTEVEDSINFRGDDLVTKKGVTDRAIAIYREILSLPESQQKYNGSYIKLRDYPEAPSAQEVAQVKALFNDETLRSTLLVRGTGVKEKYSRTHKTDEAGNEIFSSDGHDWRNVDKVLVKNNFIMGLNIPSGLVHTYRQDPQKKRQIRNKDNPYDNSVAALFEEFISNTLMAKISIKEAYDRFSSILLPNRTITNKNGKAIEDKRIKSGTIDTDGVFGVLLPEGKTLWLTTGKYGSVENFPFERAFTEFVLDGQGNICWSNGKQIEKVKISTLTAKEAQIIELDKGITNRQGEVIRKPLKDLRKYFRDMLVFTPNEINKNAKHPDSDKQNEYVRKILNQSKIFLPKNTILFEKGDKGLPVTWLESATKQIGDNILWLEQQPFFDRSISRTINITNEMAIAMLPTEEELKRNGEEIFLNFECTPAILDGFDGKIQKEVNEEIYKIAKGTVNPSIKKLTLMALNEKQPFNKKELPTIKDFKNYFKNKNITLNSPLVLHKEYERNATIGDYINTVYALAAEKQVGKHTDLSLEQIAEKISLMNDIIIVQEYSNYVKNWILKNAGKGLANLDKVSFFIENIPNVFPKIFKKHDINIEKLLSMPRANWYNDTQSILNNLINDIQTEIENKFIFPLQNLIGNFTLNTTKMAFERNKDIYITNGYGLKEIKTNLHKKLKENYEDKSIFPNTLLNFPLKLYTPRYNILKFGGFGQKYNVLNNPGYIARDILADSVKALNVPYDSSMIIDLESLEPEVYFDEQSKTIRARFTIKRQLFEDLLYTIKTAFDNDDSTDVYRVKEIMAAYRMQYDAITDNQYQSRQNLLTYEAGADGRPEANYEADALNHVTDPMDLEKDPSRNVYATTNIKEPDYILRRNKIINKLADEKEEEYGGNLIETDQTRYWDDQFKFHEQQHNIDTILQNQLDRAGKEKQKDNLGEKLLSEINEEGIGEKDQFDNYSNRDKSLHLNIENRFYATNYNFNNVYFEKIRDISENKDLLESALSMLAPSNPNMIWLGDKTGQVETWGTPEAIYQAWKSGKLDLSVFKNRYKASTKGKLDVNKKISYQLLTDILTEKFLQDAYWLQKLQQLNYLKNFNLYHNINKQQDFWQKEGFVLAMRDAMLRIEKQINLLKNELNIKGDIPLNELQHFVKNHRTALEQNFYHEIKKTRALGDYVHAPNKNNGGMPNDEETQGRVKKETRALIVNHRSTTDNFDKLSPVNQRALIALGYKNHEPDEVINAKKFGPLPDYREKRIRAEASEKYAQSLSDIAQVSNPEGIINVDGIITKDELDFTHYKGKVSEKDKPEFLTYKGNIKLLTDPDFSKVALIGSANANINLIEHTAKLADEILKDPFTVIVGGLAEGVDVTGHLRAVRKGKGRTIAIIPTPIDMSNDLQKAIVNSGGLIISEYLTSRDKNYVERLIERDRLQTMFSDIVVLSGSFDEADTITDRRKDSGAKHALNWAEKLGTPVFISLPGKQDIPYNYLNMGDDITNNQIPWNTNGNIWAKGGFSGRTEYLNKKVSKDSLEEFVQDIFMRKKPMLSGFYIHNIKDDKAQWNLNRKLLKNKENVGITIDTISDELRKILYPILNLTIADQYNNAGAWNKKNAQINIDRRIKKLTKIRQNLWLEEYRKFQDDFWNEYFKFILRMDVSDAILAKKKLVTLGKKIQEIKEERNLQEKEKSLQEIFKNISEEIVKTNMDKKLIQNHFQNRLVLLKQIAMNLPLEKSKAFEFAIYDTDIFNNLLSEKYMNKIKTTDEKFKFTPEIFIGFLNKFRNLYSKATNKERVIQNYESLFAFIEEQISSYFDNKDLASILLEDLQPKQYKKFFQDETKTTRAFFNTNWKDTEQKNSEKISTKTKETLNKIARETKYYPNQLDTRIEDIYKTTEKEIKRLNIPNELRGYARKLYSKKSNINWINSKNQTLEFRAITNFIDIMFANAAKKQGRDLKEFIDELVPKVPYKHLITNYQKWAMRQVTLIKKQTISTEEQSIPIKENKEQSADNQPRLFSHLNLDTDSPLNQSKADAVNFISKVLGDSVGVAFRENAWGEKKDVVGEFSETDGKRLITLAMTGDMLSTAYHESFHAFLGTLKDKAPQHYKKLLQLSKQYREPLLAKLKALSPAAHESAMFDDEELATYAYQLTMMGMLPSNALQKKVLGKIQQMLYTVGGLFNQTWRNQAQESADVLEAETQLGMVYRKFNEGAMATSFSQEAFLKQLNTDLNKKRHAQTLNNVMDALGKWGDKLLYSADAVLRRPNIDALNRLADKFYNDVVERSDGSLELGDFTTKIGIERNRWVNEYLKAVGDLEDNQKKAIRKALLYKDVDSGRASLKGNKALEEGYDKMRAFFDALYEDLAERGIHSKVMKKTGKKDEDGNDIYETNWIAWKNKKKDGSGAKYRKNYFPFVWSQNAIKANREKFISLLVPEIEDAVNKKLITLNKETGDTAYTHAVYLTDSLLGLNHEQDYFSTVPDNIHGTPYGSATESRYLGFIQNREKFDEFFEQDMDNVVADYVIRQTKRATFQNIFGYNGGELNELMKKAEAEIAHRNGLRTPEELADLNIDPATAAEENAKLQKLMQPYHDAVAAMLGALGQDLAFDSPLRTINAFGVTYQNFRLLTFSLFTSFQDVAGLFIHGGTLQDAFDGFLRGLNQIWHTWRKTKSKDEWVELAADFGIVDPLSYLGSIGELNGTQYMTGKMRGYSNKFFRIIGLEGWNRGLRTQAAIIAERQIKKWQRDGLGDTKAEQMLYKRIFGSLNPKDIQMDGEHLRNNDENRYALRRMVDDMIMAPTAANRPAWASNPRYLLFAQLKTFTYTMHRVMMRGIVEQVRLGNVKPAAAAVASIFPLALAGYMVKELALSAIDDDDEDWKFKPNNLAGYIFQRAGVLGVPQMYLEDVFSGDFARMLGPTADQIQGWASIPFAGMQFPLFGWTVSHNHQVGKELVNASPFASLVKRIPGMYSS